MAPSRKWSDPPTVNAPVSHPIRIRFGEGKQARLNLMASSPADAKAREETLRTLAAQLVTSGRRAIESEAILRTLAKEDDPKEFHSMVSAVRKNLGKPRAKPVTFQELADDWTSGRLSERYPDQISKKSSADDDAIRIQIFFPTLGKIPVHLLTLDDCQRAMTKLPPTAKTSTTRRQYGQLLVRLMKLAVFPCRLIEHSPIPTGFLPKVAPLKAMAWLYPEEDKRLLACVEDVPLMHRVLWGFLSREGCRVSEALALTWSDLDLERGTIKLDENKTKDPRAWVLDPGVVRALKAYRPKKAKPHGHVFQAWVDETHLAMELRLDLRKAGVTRAELFERSASRLPIRVHDLRGTFVTLSLANGKTETWVADRTGHASSVMINRYRRIARTTAELGLGNLIPLDQAIPEFRPKKGEGGEAKGESGLENQETNNVSPDRESGSKDLVPKRGVEPPRGVASADFELKVMEHERHERAISSKDSHVEVHEEAWSLTPDSPQVLKGGAWNAPPSGAQDALATVLKEALALATKHGEWGLVASIARVLEGRPAMVALRGGKLRA